MHTQTRIHTHTLSLSLSLLSHIQRLGVLIDITHAPQTELGLRHLQRLSVVPIRVHLVHAGAHTSDQLEVSRPWVGIALVLGLMAAAVYASDTSRSIALATNLARRSREARVGVHHTHRMPSQAFLEIAFVRSRSASRHLQQ